MTARVEGALEHGDLYPDQGRCQNDSKGTLMEEDGENEFVLSPVADRPDIGLSVGSEASPDLAREAVSVEAVHRTEHASAGTPTPKASSSDSRRSSQARTDRGLLGLLEGFSEAVEEKTDESELPVHRSYPTLESITQLYRLFGYVGVLGVFGYLVFQFYRNVWLAEEGTRLEEFEAYMSYALPYIFGSVVGAGVLFGAAEGIKLAIDIQENTLEAARRGLPKRTR